MSTVNEIKSNIPEEARSNGNPYDAMKSPSFNFHRRNSGLSNQVFQDIPEEKGDDVKENIDPYKFSNYRFGFATPLQKSKSQEIILPQETLLVQEPLSIINTYPKEVPQHVRSKSLYNPPEYQRIQKKLVDNHNFTGTRECALRTIYKKRAQYFDSGEYFLHEKKSIDEKSIANSKLLEQNNTIPSYIHK